MKDGFFLSSLKRFNALCFRFDTWATRCLRREGGTIHQLRGSCNGCGCCCTTPMIAVPRYVFHSKLIRKLFLAWHRHVNGFVLLEEKHPEHIFVFTCTHYDPESKRCDSYASRPGMCRAYPRNLLDSPNPPFHKSCGYRALYSQADAFLEALDDLDLPADKRREIERKLHLRDEE